jgi:putative sigma-54 modulation protein
MNISIRGRRVPVSPLLHDYSTARARTAFASLEGKVERVDVVFTDLNGPRGGRAQACRLFVRLWNHRTVIAEARELDFYSAVRRGTARARQAVGKALRAMKEASKATVLVPRTSQEPRPSRRWVAPLRRADV